MLIKSNVFTAKLMMNRAPKSTNQFSIYIRDFLSKIRKHGVVNFCHDITFANNEISMLMPDEAMVHYYCDNNIPIFGTNSSGRILQTGIYINHILENQYPEYLVLIQGMRKISKRMGLNYGRNSLHYAFNEEHCQHLYSIFFDLSDVDFLHFVVNNGAMIQDMIDLYIFLPRILS